MDDKRNRTSAIPRPLSRLPLPRSSNPTTSTSASASASAAVSAWAPAPFRPSSETTARGASNQSVTANNNRNSRIRSTSSREQLNASSSGFRKTSRSNAPPVSSRAALQDLSSGRSSRSRSTSRGAQQDTQQSFQDANGGLSKRPLPPKLRPSGQPMSTQGNLSSPVDDDDDFAVLLPSTNSTDEDLVFDPLSAPPRKPRPSLTERTIETLSQLPASPAVKRRNGNFFDGDAFKRSPSRGAVSRPGSSHQSDCSAGRSARSSSRPGSGSGQSDYHSFRASSSTYKAPLSTSQVTPKRTSTVGLSKAPASKTIVPVFTPRSSLTEAPSHASFSPAVEPRTPSPKKRSEVSTSKYVSKSLAARPLKQRASVNGLFKRPSMSSLYKPSSTSDLKSGPPRKASLASVRSSSTSGDGSNLSSASTTSTAPTVDSIDEPSSTTGIKSSAALRDQIAKAKAAKRAASQQASEQKVPEVEEVPVVPTDNTFDFGLADDPFGHDKFESSNRKVMQSRICTARTTGRLNIAAMGLKEIPEDVLKMYDLESVGQADGTWAESVDLTRLVVADNELETIDDAIFPDIEPNDFESGEDDGGRIFWGLESADFHNNMLISLPMGLRRLELLASLNLASNKLTNNCLEIISKCSNLRDLKLGNNLLYGAMDDGFILENLEILDLHGNSISSLPLSIDRMKRLRILNLDENDFESLPFKSLSKLPLTELLVRKNKLSGTLIESGVEGLPHLQILDCSSNQLTFLVSPDATQPLKMPSLHQLSISVNRIKALPDMNSWASILTLNADDNSIAAFPEGFTSRETLRHAGFSSNDIRTIPPEVARMDNLAMLRVTGNPLRDKKFTSLSTEELKDALAARLEPLLGHETNMLEQFGSGFDRLGASSKAAIGSEAVAESVRVTDEDNDEHSDYDDFATPPTSAPNSPDTRSRSHTLSSQTWPVKPGGIIDRSNTQSSSLHPVVCSKIAAVHTVREVRLQHNTFTQFPNSLSFFTDTITSLTISHNQLTGESWLTEQLDLTALRELNLQSNFSTSLTPLTTYLCAPNLEKLDVSFNRVVRLPTLRDFFPSLTTLLISNNRLEELDPESVKGMKIVDAANNEIAHLNPRLGLLHFERLDVMGNRFRVPRWNVLERGTEATLRWLRGRVPVAEMAEWKAKAGEGEAEGEAVSELD
ncbi:hypothetical protein F5X99DRAFT_390652 [Biscogniauxia marginata]|nr:hypothetical protein F5X99DRAFT_390652 [Biscogniauxia marginata]